MGGKYRFNDVKYTTNSALIEERSKLILNEFAIYLNENPTFSIGIYGHTDNVGDPSSNLSLSNARALGVVNYLVAKGVAPKRLSHKGFGETDPLESNETEEGKAENRRTEFVLLGM